MRNSLLDWFRGITIFLVVLGHSIQYATDSYDFFGNPIFILIYSWHMPAFFAASGYLFWQSQGRRNLPQLLKAKAQQLVIPLLCWALAILLAENAHQLLHAPTQAFHILSLYHYAQMIFSALWFLWTLFACATLTAIATKLPRIGNSLLNYALMLLLVLLLPNAVWVVPLYFLKFALPFYLAAFLYAKYAPRLVPLAKAASYLSFLAWPLLLIAWRKATYIYISGPTFSLTDRHALVLEAYRYAIGAAGIVLFVTLIQHLLVSRPLQRIAEWLGTYSLGIYVLGGVVIPLFITHLHLSHASLWLYSLVLAPAVAVLVTIATGKLAEWMSYVPLLNQILFGGRTSQPRVPLATKLPVEIGQTKSPA